MSDTAQTQTHPDYPAFAWPGGYPIVYLDGCAELCPADAGRRRRGSPFVHWEGEPITCEDCGREVESAYGIPEDVTCP